MVCPLPHQTEECFLNQIFGKRPVASDDTVQIAEQGRVMATHQRS